MPTDATPLRSIVKPGELTSNELKNALRATAWLLGEQMTGRIADKVLLAKLGSLNADLLAEEEDRKKLQGK
jgi:hypothetical protein